MNRPILFLLVSLGLLVATAAAAEAHGGVWRGPPGDVPPGVHGGGPPPPPPGAVRVLETARRLSTKVRSDGQSFQGRTAWRIDNPESGDLEACFRPDLPTGARVTGLVLRAGGETLVAERGAAAPARERYREIVRRRRDPALLDVDDEGRLRLRVFPVPADGSVEVELAWTAPLPGEAVPGGGALGADEAFLALLPEDREPIAE